MSALTNALIPQGNSSASSNVSGVSGGSTSPLVRAMLPQTTPSPTPQNNNPIGNFLGGVGNFLGGAAHNASTLASNIINSPQSNAFFGGVDNLWHTMVGGISHPLNMITNAPIIGLPGISGIPGLSSPNVSIKQAGNLLDSVLKLPDQGIQAAQNSFYQAGLNSAEGKNSFGNDVIMGIGKGLATMQQHVLDPIIQGTYPGHELPQGIMRGVTDQYLGSSQQVENTLNTKIPKPTSFGGKTLFTVGDIAGSVLAYIGGGEVLNGLKLGKASMPILFATLGQTSSPSDTTVNERLAKLPIDAVAGYLFNAIGKPEGIKQFMGAGAKVVGITSTQGIIDNLIQGLPAKEAAIAAGKMAAIAGLFHVAGHATGLLKNGEVSANDTTAPTHVATDLTPQEVNNQVMNSDLKGTDAGNTLLKLSTQAQQEGKNVRIYATSDTKSPLAQTFQFQTPAGNKFDVQLIEPSQSSVTSPAQTEANTKASPIAETPATNGMQKEVLPTAKAQQMIDGENEQTVLRSQAPEPIVKPQEAGIAPQTQDVAQVVAKEMETLNQQDPDVKQLSEYAKRISMYGNTLSSEARAMLNALVNAKDFASFAHNIAFMHERFDNVFSDIHNSINRGEINEQSFRTRIQNTLAAENEASQSESRQITQAEFKPNSEPSSNTEYTGRGQAVQDSTTQPEPESSGGRNEPAQSSGHQSAEAKPNEGSREQSQSSEANNTKPASHSTSGDKPASDRTTRNGQSVENIRRATPISEVTKKLDNTIKEYVKDSGMYELPSGEATVTPALRELTDLSHNPEVIKFTQDQVAQLPHNSDGTITLYRGGNDYANDNRLVSSSYIKEHAQEFVDENPTRTLQTFHVYPEDIKAFVGGQEAEVLVPGRLLTSGKTTESKSAIDQERPLIIEKSENQFDKALQQLGQKGQDIAKKEGLPKDENKRMQWIRDLSHEVRSFLTPTTLANDEQLNLIFKYKGDVDLFRFLNREQYKNLKVLGKQMNLEKYWNKFSKEEHMQFLDNYENARPQPNPTWAALDKMYRARYDAVYDRVSKWKDVNKIENYFKRLWDLSGKKEGEFNQAWRNAKKGLQGDTSWTKQRFYKFFKDAVANGVIAKETNPEVVTQQAEENAARFDYAKTMFEQAKAAKQIYFVKVGGETPEGFADINDKIASVFLPPEISVQESYDQGLWDKLNGFAKSLQIGHERKVNIGGKRLGYTSPQMDKIVTKFASPMSAIAHEIGHQVDYKYDLQDKFLQDPKINNELRALADKRYQGHDAPDSFKQYIRKGSEKMAVMFEAYIHTPELFKQTAPKTFAKFEAFLNSHEELKPFTQIRPSLVLGGREGKVSAGGAVLGGKYVAQENFARLINNHLSQDKFSRSIVGRALHTQKALFNGFQLSFSAFHPSFLGLDSLSNKLTTIERQGRSGNIKGLARTFGTTPVSLIDYYMQGNKVIRRALAGDPEALAALKSAAEAGSKIKQPEVYKATVLENFQKNLEQKNPAGLVKATARAPYAVLEASMRPLFDELIPKAKLGVFFENYAQALTEHAQEITAGKTDKQTIARQLWRDVEDRMGELNYENLFWNNTFKGGIQVMMRAPGWFKGTLGTLGGGSYDNAKYLSDLTRYFTMNGDKPVFTQRGHYMWNMLFTTMAVGAVYQYLHTGIGPQQLKDYFMPKNGAKDANGNDIRIVLPTYFKDAISLLNNPVRYVENKTAPEVSLLMQVLNNQDFFGNEVYNPTDPLEARIMQGLGYVLQTGFMPFSYQQSTQQTTTQAKIEALFGLMKAPSQYIQSPEQKALLNEYQNKVGLSAPKTPEQVKIQQLKTKARTEIQQNGYQNSPSYQALVQNGTLKTLRQRQDFIKSAKLTTNQRMLQHLPKADRAKYQSLNQTQ